MPQRLLWIFVIPLVVLPIALRAYVEAFKIPSGSMAPTIKVGDHIFAVKTAYGLFSKGQPRRGDVIVFQSPEAGDEEPADYVKRVVGLPGDVIETDSGQPIINGVRVPSCKVGRMSLERVPDEGTLYVEFLDGRAHLAFYEDGHPSRKQGPFHVEPNQVFVMGDNRDNARDSRVWFGGRGGGVPFENIKGRAAIVWLPTNRFGLSLGAATLDENTPPEVRKGLARCLAGPH